MGVPGFFLWLIKKYKNKKIVFPKVKADITDMIHNIDYLLIDMNCMIHPECFKTLDNIQTTDFKKIEAKMRINVLSYLEKIIEHNMPKKGVYLAIDGVAPVAKMKQQRLRRYKSIKDKELYDNIRNKHNKPIPVYWNNSAITPGTKFMNKLHLHIIEWIKEYEYKHKINIIYSSYLEPSEGEHKLLQFIRKNFKADISNADNEKKNYTYSIYGLDADLIFLALSTGLDNIYLMRENKILKDNKECESDGFNYVSIKIMKECIVDSICTKSADTNINNTTSIINDFIFICYLMGNDFLPHLPSLDIHDGAIDLMITKYIDVRNKFPGEYLVINKTEIDINTPMFYEFIANIAENEEAILIKKYNKKQYRNICSSTDPYDIEIYNIENMKFKVNDTIKLGSDNMHYWRKRYYNHYYNVKENEIDDFATKMVSHYLRGLKWIASYYFDKCPEWDWFYPYNTAPFLNDILIKPIQFNNIKFTLGEPITPFEQLLTVLPKQSYYLLPECLQKIMLNCNSSISHLYPSYVELEMVGKNKYWMVEPILPDIELNLIRYMFQKYSIHLTKDLVIRNTNIFY